MFDALRLPRSSRRALSAALAALLVSTAGCVADDTPGPRSLPAEAVAITELDGRLLWAELDGDVVLENRGVVATLEVSTEGQRGLVGLSATPEGRIFAGLIRPDERLEVVELTINTDGADDAAELAVERSVWVGPATGRGGNGGRVVALSDGRLLVSIGLLNDRDAQADPTSIVGKLVELDPDGPPDQAPAVVSGPWFNAFAIGESVDGALWVADNHPQDGDERLARGDLGIDPSVVAVIPADSAPTGLAVVGDEILVCSYNTQRLLRYRLAPDGESVEAMPDLTDNCLLDVLALEGGLVAYSTGQSIEIIEP